MTLATAAIIQQTWRVDYALVNVDGVNKSTPVVNGQVPGPTLTGCVGDHVRIRVINLMTDQSTTIHWHGVKQSGTPWADGVPGVTQCDIAPGHEFLYEFKLDRPGTLWWHSHTDLQKGSLYGLIVVKGDHVGTNVHRREIPMVLSDWYHESQQDQLEGLRRKLPEPFKWVGDAQSLTINGHGVFTCSETTRPCVEKQPRYIDVDEGRLYRLRIVGASSLSHINLGIDSHNLTVVEAETTLVQPFSVRYLDVGSGTSYSALLKTYTRDELDRMYPGHNGLFWIQTNVRHRPTGARGLAILRYSFAHSNKRPSRPVPTDWPAWNDTKWSLAQARAFKSKRVVKVPKADRRIVLLGTQNRHPDGSLVWAMNNISFVGQQTPLMQSVKFGIKGETEQWVSQPSIPHPFDYNKTLIDAGLSIMAKRATHVIRLRKGEVVEVVLQNTRALGGAAEIHPWHLHLHNFWVLGYGDVGEIWHEKVNYGDTSRAVERNMVMLYPQSWSAFRFVADNAGVANFHCHIISHLAMGMRVDFRIGEKNDIPPMPKHMPVCGRAKRRRHRNSKLTTRYFDF